MGNQIQHYHGQPFSARCPPGCGHCTRSSPPWDPTSSWAAHLLEMGLKKQLCGKTRSIRMARKSAKISVKIISICFAWHILHVENSNAFLPVKTIHLANTSPQNPSPTLLSNTFLQHASIRFSCSKLLSNTFLQPSPRLLFSSPTLFRNTLPRDSFNTLYNTSPQLTIHSCSLQHFSTTLQRSSPALLYNSFQRCSTTPFSKAYYNTLLLLYDTLLHYFSTTLFANPSPTLLYNTLSNKRVL